MNTASRYFRRMIALCAAIAALLCCAPAVADAPADTEESHLQRLHDEVVGTDAYEAIIKAMHLGDNHVTGYKLDPVVSPNEAATIATENGRGIYSFEYSVDANGDVCISRMLCFIRLADRSNEQVISAIGAVLSEACAIGALPGPDDSDFNTTIRSIIQAANADQSMQVGNTTIYVCMATIDGDVLLFASVSGMND